MQDGPTVSSPRPTVIPAVERPQITIRDVETTAELHAVEDLQREVWGIPDLDVVPLSHLVATKTAGGVLVGAFDNDILAGFVYGFPAIENGQTTHHSHMLAVKPDHRGSHLGERLKLAQRERVLAQGINVVTWTFDPLRSKNAHLNFRKLGVVCDRYFRDFYGYDATSFLHQNGTDRFWVTWRLAGRGVQDRVHQPVSAADLRSHQAILEVADSNRPVIHSMEDFRTDEIVIEIPSDINAIENQSRDLAIAWREAGREAFTKAMDAGFSVVDFVRGPNKGRYLLRRAADN